MPKKIEDIVVSDRRRSIRDIPIPESRRKAAAKAPRMDTMKAPSREEVNEEDSSLPPVRIPIPRHRKGFRKKIWMASFVAVVILFFAILSLMNGATLSYVPKSAALAFENDAYTAHKSGTSGLFYSVVKLSREKSMEAPAGAEEEVSRKASGVIVVYNDSAESQRLIENTRFESPSGKIYRINKPITVPARKVVSGVTQPGSVEATVYADAAGEAYNSAPTDFTVPGLKGTARYSTIYARSKTPIAGGFVGMEKVVKAEDLGRTKVALEATLRGELYSEAEAEVPEDFILFRTLSTFDFEDLPQAPGEGGSAVVSMRGHLFGVMFKKSDLAGFLAEKKLGTAPAEIIEIPDYSALEVAFASVPPADLLASSEVNFKIKGAAQAVWVTDEVALRADLAGRHKRDVPGVLNNYPTIASANVTVRPFWKSSIPAEAEKIKISKLSSE